MPRLPCPIGPIGKPPPSPPGLRYDGIAAPMSPRRPDERRGLSRLCRTSARSGVLRLGDIVIMDMCGRPHRCKKNCFEEHGAWSGADMCPASDAACHMPPARMGVRGAGPIQSRALKARIHDLVFPIPSR